MNKRADFLQRKVGIWDVKPFQGDRQGRQICASISRVWPYFTLSLLCWRTNRDWIFQKILWLGNEPNPKQKMGYCLTKYYSKFPTKNEIIDDFAIIYLLASFPAKSLIPRDGVNSLIYPTANELLVTGYKCFNGEFIKPITKSRALELYNTGEVERVMKDKTPNKKRNLSEDYKFSIISWIILG